MFWHEICRCYSHPVESPTMLRQYIMSYCSLWILPRNFWFKIDNCLKLLKSLNFLAVSKRKGSQSILAMVQMSMDLIIILINKSKFQTRITESMMMRTPRFTLSACILSILRFVVFTVYYIGDSEIGKVLMQKLFQIVQFYTNFWVEFY